MTTPRSELVAILRTGLEDTRPNTYLVRDYAADLGPIRKTTVTVQTTALTAPLAVRSWLMTSVVDVVAPGEKFEDAERVLEGALVDVLGVLRDSDVRQLIVGAERLVRPDKHHCWRITLTLPLKED